MRTNLSRNELALLSACAVLVVAASLAPAVAQPGNYHHFADQRALWGLPYAMDVLSNLPFAVMGVAGLWLVWRSPQAALRVEHAMAALFFAGLVITAIGSTWYHLRPDDAGLAIDRYAMATAFAGLLGAGAAGRISDRAGAALGLSLLLLAPIAVCTWSVTGNVLPWVLVQVGGMAAVLWFALLAARPGALRVRWLGVLAAYGVAKAFEVGDHVVYEFTDHVVSGHTLKHVVAACAALPVLVALRGRAASVQNAPKIGERRTA